MDVSQYLEIFIDETSEHLQNLSDAIMILEKEPENMDTINEIFRAAHSLKGMAGTMGFKRLQRLAHDMENVFQEVRSGNMAVTSGLVDILFQCLDAIERYLDHVKVNSDEGTDENEAIIQELNGIRAAGIRNVPAEKIPESGEVIKISAKEKFPRKYQEIIFSKKEMEKLQEAEAEGMHIYGFTVFINENSLLKAARVFLVFHAVEAFGSIIAYDPGVRDIEHEEFEFDFSFYMVSNEKIDRITEAAQAVAEIEKVICEEITYDELIRTGRQEDDIRIPDVKERSGEEDSASEAQSPRLQLSVPVIQTKKSVPADMVASRTVRVSIEKLDALMNQLSELILIKNSLVSLASGSEKGIKRTDVPAFREQIEYLERITAGLHESVMKVRMVPIESVVQKFPWVIHDLSRKLDKKMELRMTGEDTELDRTVVGQIGEPLLHLLRNSADHGIEDAQTRRKRGKPEVGTIHLNAFQEGNSVIIEVSDDGNGIDTEGVRSKAIQRGLVTPEQAVMLSQKEIIDFLFMPSFSMANTVSDISGRGIGLDVVKSSIEALGGDVEVKSVREEGSKFSIRLPLTLAIVQALMVEVCGEKYAISLAPIETIEEIKPEEIKFVQAREVVHIRGMVIPLVRLDQLLDCEPDEEEKESLTVIIVRKGDKFAGLIVDELEGQQEIVIKSLGKYMSNRSKIISGATVLGDGEVALILDVNTLF